MTFFFVFLNCLVFAAVAAFVQRAPAAHAHDGSDQGQVAAHEIQEKLDAARQANRLGEGNMAAMAQHQDAQIARPMQAPVGIDTALKDSQIRFDKASSVGRSAEEQVVAKDLVAALNSPPQIGMPQLVSIPPREFACLPDVNQCPKGWHNKGAICIATAAYTGSCTPSVALLDMSVDEKLAFARYCEVEFPCQENCAQDYEEVCPSLWRQANASACDAPGSYIGKCSRRVNTISMTHDDKKAFGLTCGARWPCASPPSRRYSDVCPDGWTLQYGQICMAPKEYTGPCGFLVRMSSLGRVDKQAFEVSCGVSWPTESKRCKPNYAADCPSGWRERTMKGRVECISPSSYRGCSRIQSFSFMTPIEKQRWERNCGQQFPCLGDLEQVPFQYSAPDGPLRV